MEWRHSVPRPAHPPRGQQRGAGGCGSVDTAQTTGSRSYRGYGPAGPPRGQWACPPVGAAYGGCTAGRWGERDLRSELRFCARASSSENADRRPQRPRPSSYLSTGDRHRLFECSPKSNPRETDRKHQALTVCPRQVIYFFPPTRPGVCEARSARRVHARGMCCRQQGGEGAASRGRSDLGSQQQQARSHVRAAGASGEELGRARNGHGVEALCASPSQPSSPAAAGRRGLWSVDTAQTTGSRSYRGYRPAGPPRGQWACLLAGAAYGGCPVGSGGGEL